MILNFELQSCFSIYSFVAESLKSRNFEANSYSTVIVICQNTPNYNLDYVTLQLVGGRGHVTAIMEMQGNCAWLPLFIIIIFFLELKTPGNPPELEMLCGKDGLVG